MRTWVRACGAACVLAMAAAAGADDTKKGDEDKALTDAGFVKMAASDSMHESKLGEIAQVKAASPDVKAFGKRMVIDHAKAINDLRTAVTSGNMQVPDKMTEKHQKDVEHFQNYKGDNFDRDYIKHMVEDHEKGVKVFTRAAKECKNPALKTYAENTLPTLKEHLELAKKIEETLGKK